MYHKRYIHVYSNKALALINHKWGWVIRKKNSMSKPTVFNGKKMFDWNDQELKMIKSSVSSA